VSDVISNFESAVRHYYEAYGLGYPKAVQDARRKTLSDARIRLYDAMSENGRTQLLRDMFGLSDHPAEGEGQDG
jgi:hypothetical protein